MALLTFRNTNNTESATSGDSHNFGPLVSQIMPERYELAKRGMLFMASTQVVVAVSLLSGTATGFILTNPNGSGKNLVILTASVAFASAPAAIASLHLAYGLKSTTAVTQGTPLVVRSGLMEAFSGVGLAASAATLPAAPVVVRVLGGGPVATGGVESPFCTDYINGEIIIPPGSSLSYSCVTTAISIVAGMTWAEVAA